MSTTGNASHSKTVSTRVIETETGIHDFTITSFSFGELISWENDGLKSSTFSVGGYSWAIKLYPFDWDSLSGSLSIFLLPEKAASGMKVRSIISILDQSQNLSKHSFTIGPYIINGDELYGEERFVHRKELETSKCLVNDCLTIRCTLTIAKSSYMQNTKRYCGTILPPSELRMHLGNLLDSGEGTDVTFDVNGEIFHAHKIVLAAQSPIFKAELWGPMKEARSGIIAIKDVEAPVFKVMLHFLYRDCLLESELQGGGNTKQDSVFLAEHLLVAADRYELDRLRLLCEDKLCNCIDIENVMTILVLAEQHNRSQLKGECLKFLARPEVLLAVVTTVGFQDLIKSCPWILKELPIQKKRKM